MKLDEALKRIAALEKRISELEARPQYHYHYHQQPFQAYPVPMWLEPTPFRPYEVTCLQNGNHG